ncbi:MULTISPECIES: MAB_1171c family putative transporter [unclassified Crossiella]|uniref:MAB_1171c family putative transporter n=1 Tax=unclassified Crossiella TaxID=2620835 RepID=UPI001FFF69A2|nr:MULTISPECIES: MAB_1171c family putative transporter [unclassified Crossiella]MCK2244703.1 hypothetical protein [Crossiella sp. S99.2]MCK2258310.1 hypothetical protein [Crossiella sp. S99.1]
MTAVYPIATYLTLTWVLFLLARRPHDIRLRAIVGVVACWALAYPFQELANDHVTLLGLPPMAARFLQHSLFLIAVNFLIVFFLHSALEEELARRRARWCAVPLGVAVTVLLVTAALTPPAADTNDQSVTSIAVFFLTSNLYVVFGFTLSCVWTLRHARGAEPRLARGLRLAAVGLAGIVAADLVFLPTVLIRWSGGFAPRWFVDIGITLVLLGIVLFLAGVCYPAAGMRVAGLGVWWQHLRLYRRLYPLWTILHERFPQDTLESLPANTLRELYGLRGVHRRYYRRVIECRDGLVRISPYLGCSRRAGLPLAEQLRAALRAHAAGIPAAVHAVPVAIPRAEGLEADVRELVALSDALRQAPL